MQVSHAVAAQTCVSPLHNLPATLHKMLICCCGSEGEESGGRGSGTTCISGLSGMSRYTTFSFSLKFEQNYPCESLKWGCRTLYGMYSNRIVDIIIINFYGLCNIEFHI